MSTTHLFLDGTPHDLTDRQVSTLKRLSNGEPLRADVLTAKALTGFAIRGWAVRIGQRDGGKTYQITSRGLQAYAALQRALHPEPVAEDVPAQMGLFGGGW